MRRREQDQDRGGASRNPRERDLQAWTPDPSSTPTSPPHHLQHPPHPHQQHPHPHHLHPHPGQQQQQVQQQQQQQQAFIPNGAPNVSAPNAAGAAAPGGTATHPDEHTFGPGALQGGAQGWDQFAVNQQMFGVSTDFNEELYTTKLDRSRPDFKERERAAAALANEIQNVSVVSPSGLGVEDAP